MGFFNWLFGKKESDKLKFDLSMGMTESALKNAMPSEYVPEDSEGTPEPIDPKGEGEINESLRMVTIDEIEAHLKKVSFERRAQFRNEVRKSLEKDLSDVTLVSSNYDIDLKVTTLTLKIPHSGNFADLCIINEEVDTMGWRLVAVQENQFSISYVIIKSFDVDLVKLATYVCDKLCYSPYSKAVYIVPRAHKVLEYIRMTYERNRYVVSTMHEHMTGIYSLHLTPEGKK